jgi:hypothetical protein
MAATEDEEPSSGQVGAGWADLIREKRVAEAPISACQPLMPILTEFW